jgi:predicted component of type VI protein secretion system
VTCDLVLDDPMAASRQAQITLSDSGRFTIESLSDRSATMVNDRVLHVGERLRLTNGDRIQFGGDIFQYLEKVS